LDFKLVEMFTVSHLTEGPSSLAEGPSTLRPVCPHLNIAHYNSIERTLSLVESPWNCNSKTESPSYRLTSAESLSVTPKCLLKYKHEFLGNLRAASS